jgi:hypothetical protein
VRCMEPAIGSCLAVDGFHFREQFRNIIAVLTASFQEMSLPAKDMIVVK